LPDSFNVTHRDVIIATATRHALPLTTTARRAVPHTGARLRILDALTGPLPETAAAQRRKRERERLERVFPEIEP